MLILLKCSPFKRMYNLKSEFGKIYHRMAYCGEESNFDKADTICVAVCVVCCCLEWCSFNFSIYTSCAKTKFPPKLYFKIEFDIKSSAFYYKITSTSSSKSLLLSLR